MTHRALLLAAGRGSRLAPLTDDRPKCLVPLLGRPLLEHQLTALAEAGIPEVAAVGGYRRECLAPYCATQYANERWQNSNMVVSLLAASPWLAAGDSLVCYTDIVYSAQAVQTLAQSPADIAINFDPNWLKLWSARFADPLLDAETFVIDASGRLLDIGRRTSSLADIRGQYMGLIKLTPAGWRIIAGHLARLAPEIVDKLDMTALFARLIADGVTITAVPTPWPWAEVDQADDIALYENDPRFADLRAMLASAGLRAA